MSNPACHGSHPSRPFLPDGCACRARARRPATTARFVLALLLPLVPLAFFVSTASAAPRDYLIRWVPSTSVGVSTYKLSVGSASGQYDVEIDLGAPPNVQNEMQTTVQLDDAVDLYLAMRAQSQAGLYSVFSNEVMITAGSGTPVPSPTPPPSSGGGGTTFGVTAINGVTPVISGSVPIVADVLPNTGSVVFLIDGSWAKTESRAPYSLAGDGGWNAIRAWDSTSVSDGLHTLTAIGYESSGGNGAQGRSVSMSFTVDNVPDTPSVALPSWIGVTTGFEEEGTGSRIDAIDAIGGRMPLLVDSRAAGGDLRPAFCDLDADGELDLLLGFGPGGQGRTLVVLLTSGSVRSVSELDFGSGTVQTGPGQSTPYAAHNGETTPACGDFDGDGRNEIAIGLGGGPPVRLHLLDDITTGYAEYPHTDGSMLTDVGFGGVLDADRGVWPAIGDFDGDGLGELLVTRTGPGMPGLAIYEDALEGFTAVYSDIGIDPGSTHFEVPPEIAFAHDGSLRPAVGDLDGDGRDEVVLGLGHGGGRRLYILDDAVADFATIVASTRTSDGSLVIGPPSASADGAAARPGVGDLDGDGLPEIVVAYESARTGGVAYVVDDFSNGFVPIALPGGLVGVVQGGGNAPIAPAVGD